MLRAFILAIGILFFSQQTFARSCADSVRYWSTQQLEVETNPLASLIYPTAGAAIGGTSSYIASKAIDGAADKLVDLKKNRTDTDFKNSLRYLQNRLSIDEKISNAAGDYEKAQVELRKLQVAGSIGIGATPVLLAQFQVERLKTKPTTDFADDFIRYYKDKVQKEPNAYQALSAEDEKILKKGILAEMKASERIDRLLKEGNILRRSEQAIKFQTFFEPGKSGESLNKKLTEFMKETDTFKHMNPKGDEERAERLKKLSALRAELVSEIRNSYKNKVSTLTKASASSKAKIGTIAGVGAGMAAGAVGGAAVNAVGVNNNCNLNGNTEQITVLGQYFDPTLTAGQCNPTLKGLYDIATLEQDKLENLCEKVPQLPQILSDSYSRYIQKIKLSPKVSDVQPSCYTDKGTITATVGNRIHTLNVQNNGSRKYVIKGTISRETKEGKYNISYEGDYNREKDQISSLRSPELNMVGGGKSFSPEELEQIYTETEKANMDAALSGRPQTALGQSVLISRGLVSGLAEFCGWNHGSAKTSDPNGATR